MLHIKKLAPVFLAAVILQFTPAPASAHLTVPPHAIWTAGFQNTGTTIGSGEQFQVQAEARYTPPDPLPYPEYVFFARQFDFTVPAGFTVTYSYIANGECTNGAQSVHCETRNAVFGAEFPADILVLVLAPDSATGSSSLALSTTAVINGEEYTDRDSFAITILPRRTVDMALIPPAPPANALPVGTAHTDQYRVVSNGPDVARQVDFEANYSVFSLRHIRALSVTPSENCAIRDVGGSG